MTSRRPPTSSIPVPVLTSAVAVLLAAVASATPACTSRPPTSPPQTPLHANGEASGPEGGISCQSGHADHGLCCNAGSCCLTPADCPGSFRSAATCNVSGPTTDCQGTRRDATCVGFTCGTVTVEDDSACSALARDCGAFDPVICTSASDQPAATCPTTCFGDGDCKSGYACAGGSCLAITGLGNGCTGTGQGNCAANLKCENAICCGASGSTCCSNAGHCTGGLACDSSSFSCFTSCNDYDSSRCASADAYCLGNTCYPKFANGTVCSRSEQCSSGVCTCFNADCSDKRCRSSWCGACQIAADDTACGAGLGSPAPISDPKPGQCSGAVACYAGSCKKNDGVSCSSNGECGHVCIGGQCAAVSNAGGPCDTADGTTGNPDCAAGLVCEGGTCRLPLGANCPNGYCATGLLCCSISGEPFTCYEWQRCK